MVSEYEICNGNGHPHCSGNMHGNGDGAGYGWMNGDTFGDSYRNGNGCGRMIGCLIGGGDRYDTRYKN